MDGNIRNIVRGAIEEAARTPLYPGFKPGDAAEALNRNIPDIILATGEFWSVWLGTHSSRIDRVLVYLPAPFYSLEGELPTKLKLGSGKLGISLSFVYGTGSPNEKKRVCGLGVGTKEGGATSRHQIWRMDYHKPHTYRTSGRELAWNDTVNPRYNFHVQENPK